MCESEKLHLFSDNCVFANCQCVSAEKVVYSISHSIKPLPLPQSLTEAIETLLWYSPNVRASAQTFRNDYLKDPMFENAVITYFLRYMGLNNEDICFISGDSLPDDLLLPYKSMVCKTCNKIILQQKSSESKFSCLLRHLRNCIAHGQFNLLDDDNFIGFDKAWIERHEVYTAVFKLKIEKVHAFCVHLKKYPDFTISHIFQYALLKNDFTVVATMTGGYNFRDNNHSEELVFAQRDDCAIRINCSRYLQSKYLKTIVPIEEHTVSLDAQFNQNVKYIDVFYCEREKNPIRNLSQGKYVLGKQGLVQIVNGADIADLLFPV